MTYRTNLLMASLLAGGALAIAASGCELVASVDRTKIGSGGGTTTMSTGATTTTSSTTTTMSCGAAMACTSPTDCAAQATACLTNTCDNGCCGTSPAASGTTCTDNGGTSCDGAGKCVGCTKDADCTPSGTVCAVATCDKTAHTCSDVPAANTTSCTDNGGAICDGAGKCVACNKDADCPASGTACAVPTCDTTAHTCSNKSAPNTTACTDNGGKICDGAGKCVPCNQDSDCPATGTVCATPKCDTTAHTCSNVDATKGTACNDNGGVVCDGNGACKATHCSDTLKDADETDVDCGGSCGATCKDTGPQQACLVAGDCISGVCSGSPLKCQPPSCSDNVKNGSETGKDCGGSCAPGKTCANGDGCSQNSDCTSKNCVNNVCKGKDDGASCGGDTECLHGHCVTNASTPATSVCCATACATTSQSSCGTNGQCLANGSACTDWPASTVCAAASCTDGASSSTATAASTCNGTGSCNQGGGTTPCGNFKCGGTTCKTTCSSPSDCTTGHFCNGSNSCVNTLADGASCSASTDCQHSICFPTGGAGFCCQAGGCTTGGTCGATACVTGTGACNYPTSSTSCGSASCSAGTFTPAGTCNGSGSCTAGTAGDCPGHLGCANSTTCITVAAGCGTNDATGDGKCETGFWCDGVSPGACQSPQASMATCNRNSQCTSGTCCTGAGAPVAGCTMAGCL